MQIRLTVNGKTVRADVTPRTSLADFLREALNLTATHLGCEHGICGACTVTLNGQPIRACLTLAVACDGYEVRTLEGLLTDEIMLALRDAFHRHHGLQCGFCTPGMLVSARDQNRIAELGAEVIRQAGVLDSVARLVHCQAWPSWGHDPEPPIGSKIIRTANAFDDMVGGSADRDRTAAALERLRMDTDFEYDAGVVQALTEEYFGAIPSRPEYARPPPSLT